MGTLAARAHFAVESLHSLVYFAPEAEEEYPAAGLRPGGMGYFASRSAPMGAVSPGVTAATFYNFNPELVARYLPRAWTLTTPAAVVAARFRVVDRAWRRLLGDDGITSPEVGELLDLARRAATDLPVTGRALYAGHADLDAPDEPHLALWHALTLLREFRGDGHVAALVASGLSGVEALVTHGLTGKGFTEAAAKRSRGWSDEQWDAALDGLTARGLVAGNALTEHGVAVRAEIERATDEADRYAVTALGAERAARFVELGRELSRRVVGAGAFPPAVFAAAAGAS